ncbi:MAG: AAA family ATPase [Yoonia sp.]|nr:AAA family ATPase [Yoonia sp.]
MKLRKLTLHNVRKFANKTAVLGPFGDGLTTITAENESGKSTFFGALHALFFYDYGSGRKELKDMQPYSGGAMRISAEIEMDGSPYLIEKMFNLKKAGSSATIKDLRSGAILKQADDAESWITQHILTANNGPFGLLWVRQGAVDVDAGADGVNARRDVMSSVRGQIDAVTGGRRMDAIVQRCKLEFDTISTKQDKPKAGSAWKEAEDRVGLLADEQARLQVLVDTLSQDLALKKKVMARLQSLNAPELRAMRAQAITAAQHHLNETREHARKVQEADKDMQLVQAAERDITREIAQIAQAQHSRETLAAQIIAKTEDVAAAQKAKTEAQKALDAAQGEIADFEAKRSAQTGLLTQARHTERLSQSHKRLVALADHLTRLAAPKDKLRDAEALLGGTEISKTALERLNDLERRRDIAIETRKVHFARFTLRAQSAAGQTNGVDIPNGEARLIDQPLDLLLPGFGAISLQPAAGAGQGIEDPDALQKSLATELGALGVATVKAARQAHDARLAAAQDRQTAQAQIRALAPDGLETLRQEWEALCTALGHPLSDLHPQLAPTDQDTASEQIERDIAALDATLNDLRQTLPALQNALAVAASGLTEAEVLRARLQSDAQDQCRPEGEDDTLATLSQAQSDKRKALAQANATLTELRAIAPDVSAAQATYDRAVQTDTEDIKEINRLERDLARLNGAIHTQSEGAVEERLAEVAGKLERAQARAAQFASHAQSLKLLLSVLEAARADAQDTYFEPVRAELLPLLRQLHAGADFEIDADKLLVETITRNGVTDKVDVLSGGAYEQIAILTRLAFARLFAKHGNHVPIILDDALVHTDDERIGTMFNMLAQIARGQQIIVLSCRTRAFSDLGGQRAFITFSDAGAPSTSI